MKMNLFLVTLLAVYSHTGFAGGESGGGGGVVRLANGPVLMDHFIVVDDASEIRRGNPGVPVHSPVTLGRKSIFSVDAFSRADSIIKKWSELRYDSLSNLVQTALHSTVNWSFVDTEITAPPFYLSPSIPQESSVEVAAFYQYSGPKSVKVNFRRSIWNELSLEDQSGLVLHETLRQVQIGFGNGFDDEALQRATAIYLLCRPTARLNYYLFYVLSNSPATADKIYGSFRTFFAGECRKE